MIDMIYRQNCLHFRHWWEPVFSYWFCQGHCEDNNTSLSCHNRDIIIIIVTWDNLRFHNLEISSILINIKYEITKFYLILIDGSSLLLLMMVSSLAWLLISSAVNDNWHLILVICSVLCWWFVQILAVNLQFSISSFID